MLTKDLEENIDNPDSMKVVCIVPAAGRGKRLGSRGEKAFVMLAGKPLLSHTLGVLQRCSFIDEIIVVVSRNRLKACAKLVRKYRFSKVCSIVRGGKRRFNSVKNGLLKARNADFILIHDGVRPFIDQKLLKKVFVGAKRFGAALPAVPSRQTLKLIGKRSFIAKTPKRKSLWEAQTPQVFKKDLIVKAYKKTKDKTVTDDSSLVEKANHRVKIIKGSYKNIKITTPEDLKLAKILVKR